MSVRSSSTDSVDDPVVSGDADLDDLEQPEEGIALCLSGGGYRAMLFHVGALRRLAETGLLGEVKRISSVSGGSITAGVLALAWAELDRSGFALDAFERRVEVPLKGLADRTIDVRSVILGLLTPARSAADFVARAYRPLFGNSTLQDLPTEPPRFVFCTTNLQSTALWRFSRAYARDYRVGKIAEPRLDLATVVAASSAFPPFLSPIRLKLNEKDFTPQPNDELRRAPYTTRPVLSDGGVYDNLGLEPVWKRYKTILVSDGGGQTLAQERVPSGWARQSFRVLMTIDNQVRSLRKRALIDSYEAGQRRGAYWGVRTDIADYGLSEALPCPATHTRKLAELPTRLKRLDSSTQQRLVNWGYAVCDAALRRHVDPSLSAPSGFPDASREGFD